MEQNQSGPAGFDRNRLQNPQSWRRSRSDRWVAGVCGGIGRALNIDPVLVRVVMAVLIISGPGVIFYIAAWVLMPDDGSDRSAAQGLLGDRVRPDHPWLWPVVIGVCVFAAIAMMSSFDFGRFVPGPLIVLVIIWLVAKQRKNNRQGTGVGPQDTTYPAGHGQQPTTQYTTQPTMQQTTQQATQQAMQEPAAYAPPRTDPPVPPAGPSSSATQRPQDRTVEPVQPVWTEDDPLGLYVDEPAGTTPPAASRPPGPPAKGMRGVKSIVVVLTGLAIGIAALAGASTATMLVIGLATLGAGMLLGGFVGRTLALLPLGILLAVGAVASTVFPAVPKNFADTNYVAPTGQTITATGTSYEFDAGSVRLDLTKATFGPGAKVQVNGGLGEVVVKVPPDVDVKGQLSTEMGDVVFLNQSKGGHNAQLTLDDLGTDGKAGEQVTLDLNLKLGSIKVERG
ncbi:PspC domain-containing protein [Kribbella shirazensis]|uniref:Phage shock protein PspC (Stress-responsive transcriptional regulator) n=1 Tax=Kribbella shirazensis TaxID=1105143 RepID=A0A7X5VJU5_9ACTN|nr:PspC domain-containing protein [Kribbella shirazensis]NIK62399.1 phage shock protein PspC (stress-responsive transcriptional regulator) [Kribbella shirazensis]